MANAQFTIPERAACTAPQATDLFIVATDVGNTNAIKSLSVQNLLANSNADFIVSNDHILQANTLIVVNESTPATSADASSGGQIWWDSDYLYLAIANNTIRRIALTTF